MSFLRPIHRLSKLLTPPSSVFTINGHVATPTSACFFSDSGRLYSSRKPNQESVSNLFDAVAEEDVAVISRIIKEDAKLLDARSDLGWTALMQAARNGSSQVIDLLLASGASTTMTSPGGHTPLDLAKFWNQRDVASILEGTDQGRQGQETVHFFDQNILQRNAHERGDQAAMMEHLQSDSSSFIVLHNASPVVVPGASSSRTTPSLLILKHDHIAGYIEAGTLNVVFLGLLDDQLPGNLSPGAYFAIDADKEMMAELALMFKGCQAVSPYPGLLRLSPGLAAIAGHARALLDWHWRYRYCPTCGGLTEALEAGYKRRCVDAECSSNSHIQNTNYPRVDPSVIAAVASREPLRLLLARKTGFPQGLYSCLAGFVEPGESIENACIREVHEEVGLAVREVQYHSSQPWPMPSQLMLGCIAHVEDRLPQVIKRDEEELEDARWFSRQDIVEMLTFSHNAGLFVVPRQAIGHHLVKDWVLRTAVLEQPYR